MDAHFRPIEGFPGYRVSREGEVQSRWGRGYRKTLTDTWRPLKPIRRGPYITFNLSDGSRRPVGTPTASSWRRGAGSARGAHLLSQRRRCGEQPRGELALGLLPRRTTRTSSGTGPGDGLGGAVEAPRGGRPGDTQAEFRRASSSPTSPRRSGSAARISTRSSPGGRGSTWLTLEGRSRPHDGDVATVEEISLTRRRANPGFAFLVPPVRATAESRCQDEVN